MALAGAPRRTVITVLALGLLGVTVLLSDLEVSSLLTGSAAAATPVATTAAASIVRPAPHTLAAEPGAVQARDGVATHTTTISVAPVVPPAPALVRWGSAAVRSQAAASLPEERASASPPPLEKPLPEAAEGFLQAPLPTLPPQPPTSSSTSTSSSPWSGSATTLAVQYKVEKPKFRLKHLSKAGGTFGTWLVKTVIKEEYLESPSTDDMPLKTTEGKGKYFVAMTWRNPCDWYVSWAHGAPGKVWGYKNPTFAYNPFLPMGYRSRPLTPEEMRAFVVNARTPDLHGFLSWYIWQLVVAPECNHWRLRRIRKEPLLKGAGASRCDNTTRMWEDWRKLDPRKLAHCFVFQETAMSDWRECFRAYQRTAPWAADAVNWPLFEAMAANASFMEQRFHRGKGDGEWRGKAPSTQKKRHLPCAQLVKEANLTDVIRSSDPFLFEKFGYKDCCVPSEHHIW